MQNHGQTQIKRAKALRSEPTEAERRLWYYLRAHRFQGCKFKRQKPIGPFIVDFVCLEKKLIVEADGSHHREQAAYDDRRDQWLTAEGFIVLRFWDHDILERTEAVLERIRLALGGQ